VGKKLALFLGVALLGYWAFSSPGSAADAVSSIARTLQDGLARAADFVTNL
jgi:hypothetical protein